MSATPLTPAEVADPTPPHPLPPWATYREYRWTDGYSTCALDADDGTCSVLTLPVDQAKWVDILQTLADATGRYAEFTGWLADHDL